MVSASGSIVEYSTLTELLLARAAERPDADAYRFPHPDGLTFSAISYTELDARARQVAQSLVEQGLDRQRIVLWLPTGRNFLAAFFGVLYAGAVAAPLSTAHSGRTIERLEAIFTDLEPAGVITSRSIYEATASLRSKHGFLANVRFVCIEDMESARHLANPVLGAAADVAVIQYTSGSTSSPKGVQVTHANFIGNARLINDIIGPVDDVLAVVWLPLFHDMGLVGGVIVPLVAGVPNVLLAPTDFLTDPTRWLRALSLSRAKVSVAPNFAYDFCVSKIKQDELTSLDLSNWRIALCGAEQVRAVTLERFSAKFAVCGFRREAFVPCYGLAEATLLVTGGAKAEGPLVIDVDLSALDREGEVRPPSPDRPSRRLVSCGPIHAAQEVKVVDPATGSTRADGSVGEIWISGAHVAQGYWRRRDKVDDAFGAQLDAGDERHFLRTGDLGFLRDGELFVVGRLKDLIIVHGVNHHAVDIEETAKGSHEALRDESVAAFSNDGDAGEELIVVHELSQRWAGDTGAIFQALRSRLLEFHGIVPADILFVRPGTIMRTSSGKIKRHAMRESYRKNTQKYWESWRDRMAKPGVFVVPENGRVSAEFEDLEQSVISTLRNLFEKYDISADQDWREYCANSIDVSRACNAILAETGIEITVRDFFDHTTVREMVECIVGKNTNQRDMSLLDIRSVIIENNVRNSNFAHDIEEISIH